MAGPRDNEVTQQLAQTNVWLPFFLVQSSYIKLLICELFGLDPDELGLGCHDQEGPRFKQVHRTTLVGLGERQLLQGAVGTHRVGTSGIHYKMAGATEMCYKRTLHRISFV